MDGFNKSTRLPTACPYCKTQICRTCLQTYLLNDISDYPKCVNLECGHGWEREFLDGEFTRSFRLTTYKEHREKILSDRERSRLPASQEDAAAYKSASTQRKKAQEEMKKLEDDIAKLQRKLYEHEATYARANRVIETHGRTRITDVGGVVKERAAPAAFIKPCPAEGCKGFLSSAWKCGLCDLWTCPDCHDLKGPERECEHTCDPDKVATASLIDKESKACPKCGVRICKIEGCDQMWCTACNTAFNWRTGRIADGPVHNPHYFAWLRSQGREPATNVPANGPPNCEHDMDRQITRILGGGNTNYYYGYNRGARSREPRVITDDIWLIEAWRIMREIEDPYGYRNNTREPNTEEEFRKLRVKYLADELNEEGWKVALQRQEKDANFQRAKNQVRELFLGACRDLFRQLLQPQANKPDVRRQIEELITYCNTSYGDISKRFGRKTPLIEVKPV